MLYFKTEDGSGYDVACAFADGPVEYINTPDEVSYTEVDFKPSFHKDLYFVHLGKKQDSRAGIREYLKAVKNKASMVKSITRITEDIRDVSNLSGFENLLESHEEIIASHTGFKRVKQTTFSDYWGTVKSLGAWGGDFVLAISTKSPDATKAYFESKGCSTVIPYKEMVLF